MPLTKKAKLYVKQRVKERYEKLIAEIIERRESEHEDATVVERLKIIFSTLTEAIKKTVAQYKRGIEYWKATGDMENSKRAAYALSYFRKKYLIHSK